MHVAMYIFNNYIHIICRSHSVGCSIVHTLAVCDKHTNFIFRAEALTATGITVSAKNTIDAYMECQVSPKFANARDCDVCIMFTLDLSNKQKTFTN